MKIAMTTLCSKILSQDKEHFAEMAVDAVFRLKVRALLPLRTHFGVLCDVFLTFLCCRSNREVQTWKLFKSSKNLEAL